MERGTAQPTQSGLAVKLRKESKFGEMLLMRGLRKTQAN